MNMDKKIKKFNYKILNNTNNHHKQADLSVCNIKILSYVKTLLQALPLRQQFDIQSQSDYLRSIAQVVTYTSTIRLQQITYIISQESYRKLVDLLAKLTSYKQVVVHLLASISKGFSQYSKLINDNLFQVIQFLILMQGLSEIQYSMIDNKAISDDKLKKLILKSELQNLINQIIKWYGLNMNDKSLSKKYQSLMISLTESNYLG